MRRIQKREGHITGEGNGEDDHAIGEDQPYPETDHKKYEDPPEVGEMNMFGELPDQLFESSDPKQRELAEKFSPNKDLEPMTHQNDEFGEFGQFDDVQDQHYSQQEEGFGDFGEFEQEQNGQDNQQTKQVNEDPPHE